MLWIKLLIYLTNSKILWSKHRNDSKLSSKSWNDIDNIYGNIDEYNSNKLRKKLIALPYMFADMLSNEKPKFKITQLFIRSRKVNIFIVLLHNVILFLLVSGTTLVSDNRLCFICQLLKAIQKFIITIDDKIREENYRMILAEKQQKAALSSGKEDKYEYLTGEKLLPPPQSEILKKLF